VVTHWSRRHQRAPSGWRQCGNYHQSASQLDRAWHSTAPRTSRILLLLLLLLIDLRHDCNGIGVTAR